MDSGELVQGLDVPEPAKRKRRRSPIGSPVAEIPEVAVKAGARHEALNQAIPRENAGGTCSMRRGARRPEPTPRTGGSCACTGHRRRNCRIEMPPAVWLRVPPWTLATVEIIS